jgi:hypothetical protein
MRKNTTTQDHLEDLQRTIKESPHERIAMVNIFNKLITEIQNSGTHLSYDLAKEINDLSWAVIFQPSFFMPFLKANPQRILAAIKKIRKSGSYDYESGSGDRDEVLFFLRLCCCAQNNPEELQNELLQKMETLETVMKETGATLSMPSEIKNSCRAISSALLKCVDPCRKTPYQQARSHPSNSSAKIFDKVMIDPYIFHQIFSFFLGNQRATYLQSVTKELHEHTPPAQGLFAIITNRPDLLLLESSPRKDPART